MRRRKLISWDRSLGLIEKLCARSCRWLPRRLRFHVASVPELSRPPASCSHPSAHKRQFPRELASNFSFACTGCGVAVASRHRAAESKLLPFRRCSRADGNRDKTRALAKLRVQRNPPVPETDMAVHHRETLALTSTSRQACLLLHCGGKRTRPYLSMNSSRDRPCTLSVYTRLQARNTRQRRTIQFLL